MAPREPTTPQSGAAAGAKQGAEGAKPERPEDVIHGTDFVLPVAAVCAHAYWLHTKYQTMIAAGDVAANSVNGGVLDLPVWEPFGMSAAYLAAVFTLTRMFKAKGAEPLRCRAAMIVHNIYLTGLSFFMAAFVWKHNMAVNIPWHDPSAIFSVKTLHAVWSMPLDRSVGGVPMAWIIWVNYNSKFVEYLDTLFMIVRQKWTQVTFLHVEHHAIMGPMMWLACTTWPGGASSFGPFLNSVIHTVMYAYYACLAAKVTWPFPKQLITMMQLAQFFIVGGHGLWNYVHGTWTDALTYSELALIVNMIVLFGNYFYHEYIAGTNKRGKGKEGKGDKAGSEEGKAKADGSTTKLE